MKSIITKTILIATLLVSQLAYSSFQYPEEEEASAMSLKLEKSYHEIAHELAASHNKYGACPADAYTQTIAEAVRKARYRFDANYTLNQNENRKFKVSHEVSKVLKSTLFLKDVMNMLDHNDMSTFEHALNRVVMWGPAPGAYGHISRLEFGANNQVEYLTNEYVDESPWFVWSTPKKGRFDVFKNKNYEIEIRLTFEDGTASTYILSNSYTNNWMWQMVPADKKDANPYLDGFVDYPSECDS